MVDTNFFARCRYEIPDSLDETKRAQSDDVGRVLRLLKRDFHMRLSAQVVYLIRLNFLQNTSEPSPVSQIPIMEKEMGSKIMGVLIEMVNSVGIKGAGSTNDPVHFVPFGKEKLCQIRTVLTGDAGDQGASVASIASVGSVASFASIASIASLRLWRQLSLLRPLRLLRGVSGEMLDEIRGHPGDMIQGVIQLPELSFTDVALV